MDIQALSLTLRLATLTTIFLLAIAIPLSYYLSKKRTVPRSILQAVVALPLILPPTVIGFYLLIALGPLHPVGRVITAILGHPLAFSFTGLLIGSLVYSLPFAVQPLIAGFQAIDPELAETAALLGEGPFKTFRRITLPLSQPALITAAVLTFMHTVGEFGVVLMIGGNISGLTRTLSISLFDMVEDGRYAEANHTALVLMATSIIALVFVYTLRPQGRVRV